MRSTRKLALSLAAAAATTLVALVGLPYLFRDRIAERLKLEIGRSVDARVSWSGVGLSVLRDFPNVTLDLDRPSVVGVKSFEGDTLVAARSVRLVLDLGSVVRHLRGGDRIVVREIALARPVARLRVLRDGRANWDIVRESSDAKTSHGGAVGVTLRDFRISDGSVMLDDQQAGLVASVAGLEERLLGDFGQNRLVIVTRTSADSVSLRFAGVPYLSHVKLALNADLSADLRAHRFVFRNDSLRLNDLVLAFSGAVTAGDTNVALDVAFSAPSTRFRDILSLVPAIYARDFQRLQTSGTMSASGRVRGQYGPHAFPSLALRARVEDGAFRYPDLPLPARDIAFDLAVDNPGGHVDSTVVSLTRFHATIGRQPVEARFVMRTPVSDPDVDLSVAGSVDLADVARTVKLAGVSQLSGTVAADVAMRARMSQLDAGRYEQVAARGTVGIGRLALRSASLPQPLALDTAALRLTPRRAELTTLVGRIGRSDVRATGGVDNLLGFALRGEELRGSATVNSEHVDLNEWASNDEALEVIPVPANVDLALQANVARVTYGALTAANVHGGLRVKDQRVTLEELRMDMLRGSVVANGFYETTVATRPTFDLGLRVATIDIPSAFTALTTVQKLAPVARWAQGAISGDFALKGALGGDMMPAFDALTGRGSLMSDRVVLQGAPVMEKLSASLALAQLRNPAIDSLRASFEVVDGRVHVKPFKVRMGATTMIVSGFNKIDQTVNYDLSLAVPRAAVDAAAGRVVAKLAAQAGKSGADVAGAGAVMLGARVTGLVTNPTVTPNFSGVAETAQDAVKYAARQEVDTRVAAVKQRADSAADEARRRARVEAERVVAEAEKQAEAMRAEGRVLAAKVRGEGAERADSLAAKATSPGAQIAAKLAADRLRRESETQAKRVEQEANARADVLVAKARQQAAALAPSEP